MNESTAPQLKRALLALEKMQARLEASERARTEAIAVVGLGCRFPGAENPEEFWRLLRDGRDATTAPPPGRDPRIGTGGFLREIEGFDHEFFRVTPKEAAAMDPQQRVLLEVAWEALEGACIPATGLFNANTGVYVGACSFDFALWRARRTAATDTDAYFATGAALSVNAGRLSYFLGLTGPALTVDTACSSSLVAIHQGCAALRAGECELAIAGGVSLLLAPEYSINFEKAGMLAADGRCKTFDAAADGFARAEGCGLVVLKKFGRALADGDRVRAVILGSAVNQDGASGGLTVPSGPSQEAVIRKALAAARREPAQIDYVEAHGTGTSLGDPIEVHAINEVFAGRERALAVGSVKTNIGHCEAAAGVAGLIKTILAMEAGVLPGHLHLETPNPHLELGRLPIDIPRGLRAWPGVAGEPRRAGVSAFGFSGTNAHLIVEQAPAAQAARRTGSGAAVFAISAAEPKALRALAARWADWFERHADIALEDVCAAALRGRSRLECRLALPAQSVSQLTGALREFAAAGAVRGGEAPFPEVAAAGPWTRLEMPTYPFQRTRHWLDGQEPAPVSKPVGARGDLLTWITGELAAIMGETEPGRLDPRRGFADLGLDSLMAGQLAEAIERELGIDVPVMAVFNYPTLVDLAAHLNELALARAIEARFKEAYAGQ